MARPGGSSGRLRVGLVGCGYWGEKLLRNFAAAEHCEIAAIADPDPARLRTAATQVPGACSMPDARKLIASDSVDAVVLATPVSTHFPLAAQALEGGKHVLVEKPLARTASEAQRLIELAQKHQRVIDDGDLGQLLFIDSARVNFGAFQTDVNVIDDLGPHDFSIIEHLVGHSPRAVSVSGIAPVPSEGGIPVSAAYVQADFGDGVKAHLSLSWMSPVKVRRMLVCGTERMLLYDDTDEAQPVKVFNWSLDYRGSLGRVAAECDYDNVYAPPMDRAEPLARMAAHFIACASTGARPVTDGAAGLRVVRTLEAARSSLAAGGEAVMLSG